MAAGLWGRLPRRKLAGTGSQAGDFAGHAVAEGQQGSNVDHTGAIADNELGSLGLGHPDRDEKLATVRRLDLKHRRRALAQDRGQEAAVKRVELVVNRESCDYWCCG